MYAKDITYYLAIDPIEWDYYPVPAINGTKVDLCTGGLLTAEQLLITGNGRPLDESGFIPTSVYNKTVFREYTDATFTIQKKRTSEEKHLGLLGPYLRAEEGDTLVVVVRGLPLSAVSAEPLKNSFVFLIDGLAKHGPPVLIAPGKIVKHRFSVTTQSTAPSKAYVDSRMLLYQATVGIGPDANEGIYRGLFGPAIIYRKGSLNAKGNPKKINTELVSILWVTLEDTFDESGVRIYRNVLNSINGMLFCSLPGLDMTAGKSNRWYFAVVGGVVSYEHSHHFRLLSVGRFL